MRALLKTLAVTCSGLSQESRCSTSMTNLAKRRLPLLLICRIVRKQVARVAQGHSAITLQLAPYLHSLTRSLCR
jgi:hypothetical protein